MMFHLKLDWPTAIVIFLVAAIAFVVMSGAL